MKVCLIGSGGREHALAHALSRDADVIVTPGNPGIASLDGVSLTSAPPEEIDADLYVIGPEAPLVDGLADRLRARDKRVFGPGSDGARLEGSKAWMKEVLEAAGVPTARFATFRDIEPARKYLASHPGPYVIKTDGLAAGKGVLVTESREEAEADAIAKLTGSAFAGAGTTIVVEEAMVGPELSVLAVCDGARVFPLAPAQDFKRVTASPASPNTGGMGAYSPVPCAPEPVVDVVIDMCVEPLVAHLRSEGIDYRGVLYAGLMLTDAGPKVVEFNVRFGDPETQVVLPRMSSSLTELLAAAAGGALSAAPTFSGDACVTVVLAAGGYPGPVRKGDIISGVGEAGQQPGVTVYHAGTALDEDGALVTAGGRVFGVTATGPDLDDARARAYSAVSLISFDGMHYRQDIAQDAACEQSTVAS